MLNKLRNFSKSRLSSVLVFIIIIPFVMWGMGGVFNSGNTNILAKINNENVSTEELIDYINSIGLDLSSLKEKIDDNVFEETLAQVISKKMLEMEISSLNLEISDESLVNKIKKNKNFLDDSNQFSRIKYEKFLLENNMSAVSFEKKLKEKELQKKVFYYIGGGIKSPNFLVKKDFTENNKKIVVDYVNLESNYKKDFTEIDIKKFIDNNKESLEREYIDFSYAVLKPEDLTSSNEFSDLFFEKIDEIENLILNGSNIISIKNAYNLNLTNKINFIDNEIENSLENEIYAKRNENNIQLLDKNDYYLLFEVKKIEKKIPTLENEKFKKEILNNLILKEKYKFNKNLLTKIQNNKFNRIDFLNLAKDENKINEIKINSIRDNNFFNIDSVKILYTIPLNNFLIMTDDNQNIYISMVKKFEIQNMSSDNEIYSNYLKNSNLILVNNLYTAYDSYLSRKYEVKIYNNNLEKVKNYFK